MAGEDRRGINLRTLAIASASSAVAAYVIQSVWRPGTLVAAAVTPILVALVNEALNRPVSQVTRAGARVTKAGRSVVRRRPSGRTDDPTQPEGEPLEEVTRRRRLVRAATVTGLLGFLLVAVVWTGAELLAGRSLFGGESRTTYFGGDVSTDTRQDEAAPRPEGTTPAPATPDVTPTPDPDATPALTPTPTPSPSPAQPTPSPGASPGTPEPQPTPSP